MRSFSQKLLQPFCSQIIRVIYCHFLFDPNAPSIVVKCKFVRIDLSGTPCIQNTLTMIIFWSITLIYVINLAQYKLDFLDILNASFMAYIMTDGKMYYRYVKDTIIGRLVTEICCIKYLSQIRGFLNMDRKAQAKLSNFFL